MQKNKIKKNLDVVDFEPGDEVLDSQLCFKLTMLLDAHLMKKVDRAENGEGLRLWRLRVTDVEPKFARRKMVLQQSFLTFSFGPS